LRSDWVLVLDVVEGAYRRILRKQTRDMIRDFGLEFSVQFAAGPALEAGMNLAHQAVTTDKERGES